VAEVPDAIILGGGAAGLFCAAAAARRGRCVLVVDHADKLGRKILVSGGGRCNFTNRDVGPEHYRSQNPHFVRSALARFTPADFLALVEARGIAYHERDHGRLFCDDSAKHIVALLLDACRAAGVQFALGQPVRGASHDGDTFVIHRADGDLRARALVVATGGLSVPTTGATGLGYELATHFGLRLVPTAPALVPFILPGMAALSGIAVEARLSLGDHAFTENLLFTHTGLSGPAVLQISNWWEAGQPVTIDLLPHQPVEALLSAAKAEGARGLVANLLAEHLPRRLVQERLAGVPGHDRAVHQATPREVAAIAAAIHDWRVVPIDTEGWRKAEVTRGGVDTRDLSSQTMAARNVPGLFFIGEVMDVTGWLGGYNFHWAWASGHACGQAL
jgi:predicted Rossmann fold flavoprotein